MSKLIDATVSYSIPEAFDGAGEEITGSFQYLVIDTVQDGIDELGEAECKSLLQKSIKIKSANSARVKLMSENKHLAYKEMSEEAKAKMKADRIKKATAIKVLQGLSADKLAELGISI